MRPFLATHFGGPFLAIFGIFLGFVIEVSSRGVGVVVVVDIFGHLPDLQGGRINIVFKKSNIHDKIKSLIFRIQNL